MAIFPTEYSVAPAELAVMAEERGFESLFFPEHTHIPASRATPYPAGGDLPREYWSTYDPFIGLSAAAAVTSTLKVATGICLVVERDPIVTAKEVASLDRLSDGRFLFGVGGGWNREEMENHGTDPQTRFGLLRERVEAMKAIWTEEEASYSGRHVEFDRIWLQPKPVQKPHPPILVGGNADRTLDRVVRYGDEWLPNRIGSDDAMIARFDDLQRRAAEAGRDPIPVTLYGTPRDPARIERLAEAGVHRFVLWLPSAPREVIEPLLDERAELITAVAGAA